MEVTLWSDKRKREITDNFAELSAIIKATDKISYVVAECVQNFITAMDSLNLNMVDVDQLLPLLYDLSSSFNKLSISPPEEFEGKIKMMREWIGRLADEFSYNSFMAALPTIKA